MPFTGHVRKRNTKSGITTYQIIVEKESDHKTGKRERYYKTIKGSKMHLMDSDPRQTDIISTKKQGYIHGGEKYVRK